MDCSVSPACIQMPFNLLNNATQWNRTDAGDSGLPKPKEHCEEKVKFFNEEIKKKIFCGILLKSVARMNLSMKL